MLGLESKGSDDRATRWAKAPDRAILALAWPSALSGVSFAAMNVVDALFVGGLGKSALAAIGLAGVIAFGVAWFPFGLLRAVTTLVSQDIGAGRAHRYGARLAAALAVGAALGVLALGLGEVIALLLPRYVEGRTGELARDHLLVRLVGVPVWCLFGAVRNARIGKNDTRTVMFATVGANLVNVALNALFVLVFDWGVVGSASATVLSQASELGALAYVEWSEKPTLRLVERSDVIDLLRLGVPTGLQFVLEIGSFALLTAIITSMGEEQLAAHHVALKVFQFAFNPIVALAEAASILAGMAVGARRHDLVLLAARRATVLGCAACAVPVFAFVVAGRFIATFFATDPVVIATIAKLLLLASAFLFFDAIQVTARLILRALGDVWWPAAISVTATWLCTPPLAWFLGEQLGLGAAGGWLGLTLESAVAAALLWPRLTRAVERRDLSSRDLLARPLSDVAGA